MQAEQKIIPLPATSSNRFEPPTLEQVIAYGKVIGLCENECAKYYYFYDAKDWMVGRNKMKRWVSALVGWKLRNTGNDSSQPIPPQMVSSIATKLRPDFSITRLKADRFTEVKQAIKTILANYQGLQDKTQDDIDRLKLLRIERDQLSKELGVA